MSKQIEQLRRELDEARAQYRAIAAARAGLKAEVGALDPVDPGDIAKTPQLVAQVEAMGQALSVAKALRSESQMRLSRREQWERSPSGRRAQGEPAQGI